MKQKLKKHKISLNIYSSFEEKKHCIFLSMELTYNYTIKYNPLFLGELINYEKI